MTRKYFDQNFVPDQWEKLEEILEKLKNEKINNVDELKKFLEKYSELSFIMSEYMAWKYIKMTCNADDTKYTQDFNEYYANVASKAEPYAFEIDKKIFSSEYFGTLDSEFDIMKKIIENDINLYREKNIDLSVKENELTTKYSELSSKLTVLFEGEEKTLIQMRKYQKDPDRNKRKEAWIATNKRLKESKEEFNQIFDDLKKLRIEKANNADFENYRDYMHRKKGRFDYSVEEIKMFHNSVEKVIVPFVKEVNQKRKQSLGVEQLKPWDMDVDLDGKILKPFSNENELVNKMIKILGEIDNSYGEKLQKMKDSNFLDLENRKGKAPGGYNYPLEETGAAFIFMNSVGLHSDMVTLAHEAGHAMHSFATSELKYIWNRNFPSEVAELASMSMELITMDYWGEYYSNYEDLKKAKKEQMVDALKLFPWVMIVDEFQHWIYTNPNHSIEEREEYFEKLMDRFNAGVDWTGVEEYKKSIWFRQLHIFEVPFYYIEYAMSQLGALAIYKNYKENPKNTIEKYNEFLKQGYKRSVKDLYEIAGIKFDFSMEYIADLVAFVKKEIE